MRGKMRKKATVESTSKQEVGRKRKGREKIVLESSKKQKISPDSGRGGSCPLPFAEPHRTSIDREVELRIAAVKAVCLAETENLLSLMRLLRASFSKEQLELPALNFFQENLLNLSVERNDKHPVFELQWTVNDSCLFRNQCDKKYGCASLSNFLDGSAIDGLQFSTNSAAKTSILETANLEIPDFNRHVLSQDLMHGRTEQFQIPGTGSHLSLGIPPKILRQPKNGEILLSIHGSPLGVFKKGA